MSGQGLVRAVTEEGRDEHLVRVVGAARRQSSQIKIVNLVLIGPLQREKISFLSFSVLTEN